MKFFRRRSRPESPSRDSRKLMLQHLEQRILWDATAAPIDEPSSATTADQVAPITSQADQNRATDQNDTRKSAQAQAAATSGDTNAIEQTTQYAEDESASELGNNNDSEDANTGNDENSAAGDETSALTESTQPPSAGIAQDGRLQDSTDTPASESSSHSERADNNDTTQDANAEAAAVAEDTGEADNSDQAIATQQDQSTASDASVDNKDVDKQNHGSDSQQTSTSAQQDRASQDQSKTHTATVSNVNDASSLLEDSASSDSSVVINDNNADSDESNDGQYTNGSAGNGTFESDHKYNLIDANDATDTTDVAEQSSSLTANNDAKTIVIVDSRVSDHSKLLGDTLSAQDDDADAVHVVVLDADKSGVDQITRLLADRTDLKALHIISHGQDSTLVLGNERVTADTLKLRESDIAKWSKSFSERADLLIYGCDVAESDDGKNFVKSLASMTATDVAASSDTTGHTDYDGDWDLEFKTGLIEETVIVSSAAAAQFVDTLDPPTPSTSIDIPPGQLINQQFDFSVTFDNTAAGPGDVGYGPYVDVVLDAGILVDNAATGAVGVPTSSLGDIEYIAYDWDGTSWIELDASGAATGTTITPGTDEHPFYSAPSSGVMPVPSGTGIGDRWYVLELPFGSYTEVQPELTVDFTAVLSEADGADIGTALDITARGGFRFGTDAVDNPGSDPQIFEAVASTGNITPQLMSIEKEDDLTESETVSGPNYPVTYTITVDIAPGQSLTDIVIEDLLPSGANYRGDLLIEVGGVDVTATVVAATGYSAPPVYDNALAPDNIFNLPLGALTGDDSVLQGDGAAAPIEEVVITYSVFFDDSVVDDVTGDEDLQLNESLITATHTSGSVSAGDDGTGSEGGGRDSDDIDNDGLGSDTEHEVNSISINKNYTVLGGGEPASGSTLEWTLRFNISDYFGFEDLFAQDLLGDGLDFDQTYIPVLQVFEEGVDVTGGGITFGSSTLSGGLAIGDTWGDVSPAPDNNPDFSPPGPTPGADASPFYYGEVLTDGRTELEFSISRLLAANGIDPQLLGDILGGGTSTSDTGPAPALLPARTNNGTYGTIVFRTVIRDDYRINPVGGSGDLSIDVGDSLNNEANIIGELVEDDGSGGFTGSGEYEDDDTAAELEFARPTITKTIYAVNGVVGADPDGLQGGDQVTYRLRAVLPSANVEDLIITDYFPLPVLSVGDLDITGLQNGPLTANSDTPIVAPTLAGNTIEWGTDTNLQYFNGLNIDTGNPYAPTLTEDTTGNSLTISFGSFDNNDTVADGDPGSLVLDILITIEFGTENIADGLYLTNQTELSTDNTVVVPETTDAAVKVQYLRPDLAVTKGVADSTKGAVAPAVPAWTTGVVVNNVGAGPSMTFGAGYVDPDLLDAEGEIDGDLTNTDGGDAVRFVITIRNDGAGDAHGISLTDSLPTGFVLPPNASDSDFNLQIWRGDGIQLGAGTDYNAAVSGGNLTLDFLGTSNAKLDGNRLETTSTELSSGAVDGDEVFFITYDLVVDNETVSDVDIVNFGESISNTAQVTAYYGQASDIGDLSENIASGDDDLSDDANVTIITPTVAKNIVATGINGTNNDLLNEATIGEYVTYEVVVTLPEGEAPLASIVDALDPGLEFVRLDSIIASGTVSSSIGAFTVANFGSPSLSGTPASGQTMTFDLGTINNSDNDNDTVETLTVRYTVKVNNIAGNQDGISRDNGAAFSWDADDSGSVSGGERTNTATDTITIVEPTIDIDKVADIDSPGSGFTTGDAGEVVYFTVQFSVPAGSPTAFDAQLSDDLSALVPYVDFTSPDGDGIFSVTDSASTLTTADFHINGSDVLEFNPASVSDGVDMSAGRTIEVVIVGTLRNTVYTSQVLVNDAVITWSSLDNSDASSGDLGEERDGSDPSGVDDYTNTDPAQINITPLSPTKSIVSTSETSTGSGEHNAHVDLTVGEIVRYRLVVEISEGTTPDLVLYDRMPTGLLFLDDDTAKVAFVSSSAGSPMTSTGAIGLAATDAGGNPLHATGDQTNLALIVPTYVLPDINVDNQFSTDNTGDSYVSGRDVAFKLGNIINPDRDTSGATSNQEFVVVEFNALVLDIASNDDGTTRSNRMDVYIDADGDGTRELTDYVDQSNNIVIDIVEPMLDIVKTVDINPTNSPPNTVGDSGDTAVYTFAISHTAASTADAFDLDISDVLPAEFDASSVTATITNIAGSVDVSASFSIAGDQLSTIGVVNLEHDSADPYTLTIQVTGTLDVNTADADGITIEAGENVVNTVNLAWDTLPGDGTASGVDNPTGSETPADGDRDYTDSDTAEFSVPGPQFDKRLTDESDTDVTIGEVFSYDLVVTVPEGITNNVSISDTLPTGLAFVSASLVTTAADSAYITSNYNGTVASTTVAHPTTPALLGLDGEGFVIDLGDITTAGDNDSTNNTFVIRVEALVLDVVSNDGLIPVQTTLTNNASLLWDDPEDGTQTALDDTSTSTTVTVEEPELNVVKAVAVPTSGDTTGDAGDAITYTFTIDHTSASTTDAHDVTVSDPLPAEFDFTGGSAAITALIDGTTDVSGNFAIVGDAFVTTSSFTLDLGSQLVITLTGVIDDDFADADGNTVDAGETVSNTVTLTWDTLTGEDPDPSPYISDATETDRDYTDTDDAEFTIPGPVFDKRLTDESDTDVTIGEVFSYDLVVTVPEGLTNDVTIADTMPAGLAFVSATLVTTAADSAYITSNYNGTVASTTVAHPTTPALLGQNGEGFVIDLGDVTTASDNDTTNNTFVVRVEALVLDVISNDGLTPVQTTLTNNASLSWEDPIDGTQTTLDDTSTSTTVTVEEPELNVVKAVAVPTSGDTTGDAGDAITYTFTIDHTGASTTDAHDVTVSDPLPAEFDFTGGSAAITALIDGTTDVSGNFAIVGDAFVTTSSFTLDLGSQLVITLTGVIDDDFADADGNTVDAGETVSNTVTLTWDTLTGEDPDPSPYISDATETDRDYTDTDDAEFTIPDPVFDKRLTDESDTDVTIGEVFSYDLIVTVPEGLTNDVTIADTMPAGLAFVSATLVTTAADSAYITNNYNGTAALASITHPTTPILLGQDGEGFVIDLGDITTASDNDTTNNTFVIRVEALVLDVVSNDGLTPVQTTLTNNASLSWEDPIDGTQTTLDDTSTSTTVTVEEPELNVVKDVAVPTVGDTSGEAGDAITYTFTVDHTGASTTDAHDVALNDPLPEEFDFTGAGAAITALIDGTTDVSANFAVVGDAFVTLTPLTLDLGSQLVVTLTGVLDDNFTDADGNTVDAGETVSNTVTLTWDTLTGEGADPSPFINDDTETDRDYSDTDDAQFTVPGPDFDKRLTDESDTGVTIGEVFTYDLVVTVTEGVTNSVSITDTMPNGLAFIDASVVTSAADSAYIASDFNGTASIATMTHPTTPALFGRNGEAFTLDLGDVTAAGDNDSTNNTFVIRVEALVLDIAANDGLTPVQTTLTNNASMTWEDPDDGTQTIVDDATTDTTVTVEEPELSIVKTVAVPTSGDTTGDAGDAITYTFTIDHTGASTTDAHDVTVSDPLPAEFDFTGGSAAITALIDGTTDVSGNFAIVSDAFVTTSSFTLDLGSQLVITLTGVIDDDFADADGNTADAGETVSNTVTLTWDTLTGEDPDPSPYISDATETDRDYTDTDDAEFTIPGPQFDKRLTDESDTDVTIGEVFSYDLVVTVPEGLTNDVTIADTMPAGLAFVSATLITTAADSAYITGNFNGTAAIASVAHPTTAALFGQDGEGFVIDLSDVIATADNDTNNNTFVIRVEALVLDVSGNDGLTPGQTTLTNDASMTWEDPDDGTQTIADDTNTSTTVTVEEPELNVVKEVAVPTAGDTIGEAGDAITYTFTVDHTGNSTTDAHDVALNDPLPEEFDFTGAGAVITAMIDGTTDVSANFNVVGDTFVTLTPLTLDLGSQLVVTLTGVLDDNFTDADGNTVDAGEIVSNTVTLTWDTLTGEDPDPSPYISDATETDRDYSDTDDAQFTVPGPGFDKRLTDETDTDVTIGEIFTYDLVVTVTEGVTHDVILSDSMPAGLAFVSASVVTAAADSAYISSDYNGTVAIASTTHPTTPALLGQDGEGFVIDLGDVAAAGDNDVNNNTFVIRVEALVLDIVANDGLSPGQTTLTNNASMTWEDPDDGTQTIVDDTNTSTTVTVQEPELNVVKEVAVPTAGDTIGEAGDAITYTFTVDHTGNSTTDAHDVALNDPLPEEFDFTGAGAVITAMIDGTTDVSANFNVVGDTFVTLTPLTLDLGSQLVVTLTGVLDDNFTDADGNTVDAGEIVSNTVTLTWDTLTGEDPDPSPYISDATETDRDYSDTDDAEFSVPGPSFDKRLTDETDTDVTIGEIFTYDLVVTVTEGVTHDVILSDSMPAGLAFVSASVVTAAADSAYISSDYNGTVAIASTTHPTTPALLGQDGEDFVIDLGDVAAAGDNDVNNNTFVIRVEALVLDIVANDGLTPGQTTLTNNASMTWEDPDDGTQTIVDDTNTSTTVTVEEPELNIVKEVAVPTSGDTSGDAGDAITYTFTVDHTGNSTTDAHDVSVNDPLPAEFDFTGSGAAITALIDGTTDVSANFAIVGDSFVTTSSFTLDLGSQLVITLTGVIDDNFTDADGNTADAGDTVANTVTLTWDTLVGENPDPSPYISDATETDRDYTDTDDAEFSIPGPSFDKRLTDETDTDVTIGEVFSYDLIVTVPEGVTNDVVLSDVMPAGLAFVSASVVTAAADSAYISSDYNGTVAIASTTHPTNSALLGQDGEGFVIDLGDVAAAGDNDVNNNTFVIRVEALVLDVVGNDGLTPVQTTLTNDASMSWEDPDDGTQTIVDDTNTSTTVTVEEPELNVVKEVAVPTAGDTIGEAGDAITYTFTVDHTGNSTTDAHDVALNDPLPEEFDFTGSGAVITALIDGTTDVSANFNVVGDTFVTLTPLTLDLGSQLVVTLTGVLDDNFTDADGNTVDAGEIVSNTVTLTWDTLTGEDPDPSPYISDATETDRDYSDTDDAAFSVPGPSFDKRLTDETDTDVTIGEIFTYDLVVTVTEGVTNDVILSDSMPAGLAFVSASVVTAAAESAYISSDYNGTVAIASTTHPTNSALLGQDGEDFVINLGDVAAAGDNDVNNNTFVIRVDALVLDVTSNDGLTPVQTTLTNNASMTWEDPDDGTQTIVDDTNTPTTVTVEEPSLYVTKDVDIPSDPGVDWGLPGDSIEYTIVVAHNDATQAGQDSTTDAHDVTISDLLPAEFVPAGTFSAIMSGTGDVSASFTLSGQNFSTNTPMTLALGESITIVISGTIDPNTSLATFVDNEVNLTWDTLPGENPDASPYIDDDTEDDRDYSDSDDAEFSVPDFEKVIVATSNADTGNGADSEPDVHIGEVITYHLTATVPNGTNVPVSIVDDLPDSVTLVSTRVLSLGNNSTSGVTTGGDISGSLLAVGATGTITAGNNVEFDFGTLTIADNDSVDENANRIVVEIVVQINNDTTNIDGLSLTNDATGIFGDSEIDDTQTIDVVEPNVEITKTFYDETNSEEVELLDAGDRVTVRLQVSNNGDGPLYNTVIEDALLPFFDSSTVTLVNISGGGFVFDTSALPTVAFNAGTLQAGETFNLWFSVVVDQSVNPNESVINTATVTGESIPDGAPGDEDPDFERTPDTDPTASGLYDDNDSDNLVTPNLTVDKAFVSSSLPETEDLPGDGTPDLTIGEVATYHFLVTLPEGTISGATGENLRLVDLLPDGMAYVPDSASIILVNASGDSPLGVVDFDGAIADASGNALSSGDILSTGVDGAGGDGNDVVIDFGEITVNGDQATGANQFLIELQAVVLDAPGNKGVPVGSQTQLTDTVTLDVLGDDAPPVDSEPVTIEVVEPELSIDKRFTDVNGQDVTSALPGDVIYIELTVRNTGTGPAFDVSVTDPVNAVFSNVSAVSLPGGWRFSMSGDTATITANGPPNYTSLMPSDTVVFKLSVTVNEVVSLTNIINEAKVDGDTIPGDDPNQRDGYINLGTDTLTVEPTPNDETRFDEIIRTYTYDVGDMNREELDELFERITREIQFQMPKLPIHYMLTGITEHHSNVTVILYNDSGVAIGYKSVLADTAGNWMITYPETVLDSMPHHIEVQVTASSDNTSTVGEFNTRTYYTPTLDARHFAYKQITVADVFSDNATDVVNSAHLGMTSPLGANSDDWNHPYEFLASITPEEI